jgi:hypothetical protein
VLVTGGTEIAVAPDAAPSVAEPTLGDAGSGGDGSKLRFRWLPPVVCFVIYAVLSILVYGASHSIGSGLITGVRTQDQIQQIWFLEWGYNALIHGHNPFFTQLQNYPVGINLGINTSMLALGVIFSPITALFGPIVTWNVLMRLALLLSAMSMCLVLRRWTSWWPAAFVGGLLYGFSGFTVFFSLGYLFLIFAPLPPLLFLLLYEIFERQRWRPVRTGVLLAVVCVVQYLISSELLASTILIGGIACVIAIIAGRKQFSEKLPYLRKALVPAIVVGGVLMIYPVLFAFAGAAHLNGVPMLRKAHSDILGHFIPGPLLWFAPSAFKSLWKNFTVYFYSAPTYQGIPFLLAIVVITVWLRKRGIVLLAGVMAVIAFILSLGSSLEVHGHDYKGIPLPFAILAHLPITSGFAAGRFSLFVDLFGAGIVAIGLNVLHARITQSERPPWLIGYWRKAAAVVVVLVVVVVIAIPLLPKRDQRVAAADTSSFFTSPAAQAIPAGSVVLTYPYPTAPTKASLLGSRNVAAVGDPLLDQAVSGMNFDLIGGYGWVPGTKRFTPSPSPLQPKSVETLFNVSFAGSASPAERRILSKSDLTADLRKFLRKYHVGTVLVLPVGVDPANVVKHMTEAIGPPTHEQGITAWFDVQQKLASPPPPQ